MRDKTVTEIVAIYEHFPGKNKLNWIGASHHLNNGFRLIIVTYTFIFQLAFKKNFVYFFPEVHHSTT